MANCGIYRIRNTRNGKMYIGSTKDFNLRKTQHFERLQKGDHNKNFQHAYDLEKNKSVFVFQKLIICSELNRQFYEQICLDKYKPEYNACDQALIWIWSDERRIKHGKHISELQAGILPKQFNTPEARQKSANTKSKNLKGKIPKQMHTIEAREKAARSNSIIKKGVPQECSRLHTPEVIAKRAATQSQQRKGIIPEILISKQAIEKKSKSFKSNVQFIARCGWYASSIHWQNFWGS